MFPAVSNDWYYIFQYINECKYHGNVTIVEITVRRRCDQPVGVKFRYLVGVEPCFLSIIFAGTNYPNV